MICFFFFLILFFFVFFFFFQAEDGIRDPLVTGVQTCALPICTRRRLASVSLEPVGADAALASATGVESVPAAATAATSRAGSPVPSPRAARSAAARRTRL